MEKHKFLFSAVALVGSALFATPGSTASATLDVTLSITNNLAPSLKITETETGAAITALPLPSVEFPASTDVVSTHYVHLLNRDQIDGEYSVTVGTDLVFTAAGYASLPFTLAIVPTAGSDIVVANGSEVLGEEDLVVKMKITVDQAAINAYSIPLATPFNGSTTLTYTVTADF